MSANRRIALVVIIFALGIAALVFWVKRPKPIDVLVTTVESGEVERTITNTRAGTLKACRRAKLSPSIGGQIANLPVHEGDAVKSGQVLFEIWNDDLLAKVALAESEHRASRARAQEACVQFEVAQKEANRLSKLHKRGIASEEQTDQAIGLAKARDAACQAATASIQVSASQLVVAQALLDRTRLTAPFDGTIAEVNGELGEYVTPSPVGIATPPAVDLIDNSCLYVAAPIDEVDAPEINAEMPARITLDAFGKEFFEGRVKRVAPYVLDVEKQARTVDVEVDFLSAKDNANMLPGYSADIEVILDARQNTLRIPTEALLEDSRVYLYDESDNTIVETSVKTGLSNWKYTEIQQGLAAGQKVVTSIDRQGLGDGVLVRIEKPGRN